MAFARKSKDGNTKREHQKRRLHAGVAHHQRDRPAGGEQPDDVLFGGAIAECTRDEPAGASDAECSEDLDAENHVAAG